MTVPIGNIVYGTDWPFVKDITPEQKAMDTIKSLLSSGFNEKDIDIIMYSNLENKIKELQIGL